MMDRLRGDIESERGDTYLSCRSTIMAFRREDGGCMRMEWKGTNRFEVSDALARGVPGLRAQKTLFLEHKAGTYEETADYGEDDTDDLEGVSLRTEARREGAP